MIAKLKLDILFVADARFEGGTSTALAAEIEAAHRGGLRAGLMTVKGKLLRASKAMHPEVAALIDEGKVALVDPSLPVDVGLVAIHHPIIMANRPNRRLRIEARAVMLVLHHPAIDAAGTTQYDLAPIIANCGSAFGKEIAVAPVSSAVRASMPPVMPPHSHLISEDWANLIDLADWPQRPPKAPSYPVVIARHSRQDILKWPDTRDEAVLAYPDDASRFQVRILGGGDYLRKAYGKLPGNWHVEEFRWTGISEFLQQTDFYVYFHSAAWSEAFGRTIMEAMATGLVVILPPLFEPLFGDAAVYCTPGDVRAVIDGFVDDPDAYAAQGQRARDFMAERLGLDQYMLRLQRVFPWLAAAQHAPYVTAADFLTRERVVFISSNGIGLGHVTRQMAIAQRLPSNLQAIFATMSQGMRLVRDAGYLTLFLPYHRYIKARQEHWNLVLAQQLFDLFAFLRPRAVVFDGSMPYSGLLSAFEMHRDIISIWLRRPLWRSGAALPRSKNFDLIVEPGELADAFDHGPTKQFQREVFCAPPVLHVDPSARRPRHEARAALGLAPGDVAVALQLGAGYSYDMAELRRAILDEILAHPKAIVLDIRSPIEFAPDEYPYEHPRLKRMSLFPAFSDSLAFDAAVSAVGYNSFHEQIFGAIPTLFVPNESPETELQLARALYAELNGLGLCVRRGHDRFRLKEQVTALLDPAEQAEMSARCRALPYSNGANQIARFISDYTRVLRTDYDVTKVG